MTARTLHHVYNMMLRSSELGDRLEGRPISQPMRRPIGRPIKIFAIRHIYIMGTFTDEAWINSSCQPPVCQTLIGVW